MGSYRGRPRPPMKEKRVDNNALHTILQDLQHHIEGLEQLVILQRDGTPLAQLSADTQAIAFEGFLTELAGLSEDVSQGLQQGVSTEAVIKGQKRFLALYREPRTNVLLGILGRSTVNFGLLNSGCRIAIQKIEKAAG